MYAYTDDRKTEQQKERAAKLLSQLLELIDERDKLERRKMSAEKRCAKIVTNNHFQTPLNTCYACIIYVDEFLLTLCVLSMCVG